MGLSSRTSKPILGLFVLKCMDFSCRIQIWQWKFEFRNFLKKKKLEIFGVSCALDTHVVRVNTPHVGVICRCHVKRSLFFFLSNKFKIHILLSCSVLKIHSWIDFEKEISNCYLSTLHFQTEKISRCSHNALFQFHFFCMLRLSS